MRKLICILIIACGATMSCDSKMNELELTTCEEDMLELYEMKVYNGGELDGQFWLESMLFEGEYYFQLGSHFADIIWDPADCDGIRFCETNTAERCEEFFNNTTTGRIIGITEH